MFNKFNKKSYIGVSISDYSAKVLKLNETGDEVLVYGKTKFEDGVVERGVVKDKEKLIEVIKKLFENVGIKTDSEDSKKIKINFNIPEARTFICVFDLPKETTDKNLKNAILKEVVHRLPVEVEEVYWNFVEIKKSESRTIFYYAVFKETAESYLEVMKKAGLDPVVLGIESVSLGRSILSERNDTSSVIIDIGDKDTIINIFDENNIPRMSVDCSIAGDDITATISAKMKVGIDVAEKMKIENGLNNQKGDNQVYSIIEENIKKIVDETKNAINYYESGHNSKIGEIFLTGGSSLLDKLDEYLVEYFGGKIKIGDSLWSIKNKDAFDSNKVSAYFASTLGILLYKEDSLLNEVNFIEQIEDENDKKWNVVKKEDYKNKLKEFIENIKNSKLFAIFFLIICFGFLIFTVYSYFYKPMVNPSPVQNSRPVAKVTDSNLEEVAEDENVIEEETSNDLEPEEENLTESDITTEEVIEDGETYIVVSGSIGSIDVRTGAGLEYLVIDEIYPNESYLLLEEKTGWYKILIVEGVDTWITSEYTKK